MKKLLPKTSKNPQGFTLIELMVAIAIVAILSAIGMVAFSSVQKNGRDTRRRAELATIASAIEAAKNYDTGKYTFTALSTEFPGNTNAAAGTDPASYNYCVATATSGVVPPGAATANWTSGCPTSPVAYTALSTAIGGTGILGAGTATAWTVCAGLEANSKAYCISSKTQ